MPNVAIIYRLGIKELWSLARDPVLLGLIAYVFTVSIYDAANAVPDTLQNAPIALVDEDHSQLSERVAMAFYPSLFNTLAIIPSRDGCEYGRGRLHFRAGRSARISARPIGWQIADDPAQRRRHTNVSFSPLPGGMLQELLANNSVRRPSA